MGAIRDKTSSFDLAFIIGGVSFLISALMHFSLMWIDYQEKKQSNETTPDIKNNHHKFQTNSMTSDV
jgi:hypothetical protein